MTEKNLPLISVVVPVYNAKKYLKKCLKSIVNQTYPNLEIVLVDDGSTDGSSKICDDFAKKYNNIKVIHQQNTGGVISRQNGAKACTGEFVCFSDADDLFFPNTVKVLYDNLGDADFSVGNHVRITSKGRAVKRKPCFSSNTTYNKDDIYNKLLDQWFGSYIGFPVTFWGKLFRTAKILKAFEDNKSNIKFYSDDLIVTLHYLLDSQKIHVITENVYKYRMNGYSIKYKPLRFDDAIAIYNYRKNLISQYNLNEKYNLSVEEVLILSIHDTLNLLWVNKMTDKERLEIMTSVLEREDISKAFSEITYSNDNLPYVSYMLNKEYEKLANYFYQTNKVNWFKKIILKIINKILY